MKKIWIVILVCALFIYAEDSTSTETAPLNTASKKAAPAEEPPETIPPDGKPFRTAGYSLVAAGVVSLACAASFYAGYKNRPNMGEPDTATTPGKPEYKRYARALAWTGLVLEVSSVPFLVVGYKKKRLHDKFLERKLYGAFYPDGFLEVGLFYQF